MNRASRRAIIPALCVLLLAWPAAGAEEETPELELKPCTIELVDGTEVEGRLAVQFEMDDHLIVYSPGLGTVRSFLRDHIHALTVDGKREALNPKREMTEEDRELLGRMDWPDTPPAEGPKPAYTTETWGKPKRLLVWANSGVKNLRAENPSNWLLNGRPVEAFEYTPREPFVIDEDSGQSKDVSALFDTDTDVLIPVSRKTYRIVYRSEKANIALQCRHLTTDVNAMFRPRNLSRMTGNLWNRGGRGCMSGRKWIRFTGDKHTFIINNVDHPGLAPEPVGSGLSYLQTIFAHEIYFDKGKGSVHLFGPLAAKYHMKALSGTTIVGEDAMLMYASDSPFVIRPDATIELRSNGIVAYRGASWWRKEENDYRMILQGTLRGGSPEFPLTSDCYVGIPTLEHPQEGLLPRLVLAEGATLEVHTTDSERARMVVTNDQRDEGKYVSMAVEDADGLDLGAVVFDYFRRGGIFLADMDMRQKWEAASFGEHNEAESADLFAPIQSHLEKGEWRYPEEAPAPALSPIPRVHVKGRDTVRVTLTADAGEGGRIRYTLDGTVPEAGAKPYDGPITLTETTVVRARCFKDRERLGPPAGANYVITTPEVVEPDASGKTEQGLELTYFGHAAWHTSYGVFDKPPKDRSGVKNVDLGYTGGKPAALQFTGYLDIDEAGIYRFEAVTDKPSAQGNFARMWLAGRPVFEHSWYRVADDDVRLSGVVRLRPGLYTLKIQAILQGSRLELLAEGHGSATHSGRGLAPPIAVACDGLTRRGPAGDGSAGAGPHGCSQQFGHRWRRGPIHTGRDGAHIRVRAV